MIPATTLPCDYKIPKLGDVDPHSAYSSRGGYCGFEFHWDHMDWVCTLPREHWGGFHVAHVADKVVALYNADPCLWLQEGL